MYDVCMIEQELHHLTAGYANKEDLWKVRDVARFTASARIDVSQQWIRWHPP